jgi:hypothetical protein
LAKTENLIDIFMIQSLRVETSFTRLCGILEKFTIQKIGSEAYTAAWTALHFAFHAHKCAILVIVEDETLKAFIPFSNSSYDNRLAWWPRNTLAMCEGSCQSLRPCQLRDAREEGAIQTYYASKLASTRVHEHIVADVRAWWLNGHIVCNAVAPWSLRGTEQLRNMVQQGARENIGMSVFILNRRDAPMRRSDANLSPFIALHGSTHMPLHPIWRHRPMALFASFYGGPLFADALWPPPEHVEVAQKIESAGENYISGIFPTPWESRKPIAVFRGTATGVFADGRNPRIGAAMLSWKTPTLLDAGITSPSPRDRVWKGVVNWAPALDARCFKPPLSPAEQADFKYQLYIEGHSASNRLAWLLCSGSTLLVVQPGPTSSCPEQWFSKHLVAGVHYIAIKHDLSDLISQIQWLKDHDDAARAMAMEAWAFAKRTITPHSIREQCKAIIRMATCS